MEAEDVLRTAYVKVLSGQARYEGRSAFGTRLFAVIQETVLDERHRRWLRWPSFLRADDGAPTRAAGRAEP